METIALSDRLTLTEGNVLADAVSGRKLVLNPSGVAFFDVYRKHGDSEDAVREVASRFALPRGEAAGQYRGFLDLIDQGQRCEGSILPGQHHAVLEPTAACNGACPHCYHSSHADRWGPDQFTAILDEVRRGGIRSVSITGGEVFSAHYIEPFFQLAEELRRRDVTIASVSTNATFLTEQIRDRILAALTPTTVFRISLDALRGDLLDRIRPGYSRLEDPYSPILDLDRAGYPLVFTTNISTQPLEGIAEIGAYLRSYRNVRAWNVRMAVPVHFGAGERTRSAGRRRNLLSVRPKPALPLAHFHAILTAHAADAYPFDVRMGNYLMTSLLRNPSALTAMDEGHPCREDAELVTFKATGAVTQCPILSELDPTLTMGTIGGPDGLRLNEGFERDLPLAGLDTRAMPCHDCALRPVCGGGCRLYAVAYDEGLTGCDLPAKALLSWLVVDPTGILREHWPGYHARLTALVPDLDAANEHYAAHASGWDS